MHITTPYFHHKIIIIYACTKGKSKSFVFQLTYHTVLRSTVQYHEDSPLRMSILHFIIFRPSNMVCISYVHFYVKSYNEHDCRADFGHN